ncbi:hypothetical protein [Haliangium ochraceum]|uniref:Transmembrane protein n=1 Tax=Haliangium ochraceum (strain DSM 14365 / JCM 11303 / SMP-2) TaxID=502025 RepID=D0LYU3_HALO1|nr:hypothetical protein [Haliangium ochraceum]ACY14413.1 hypothetical protein Hoch_1865 [Haliangium ochraceum DSM 14365]
MQRYWIIVMIGFVAGISLLSGGLVLDWWAHSEGGLEVTVGMREARMCRTDGSLGPDTEPCSVVSLRRVSTDQDLDWLRAGTAGYAAAWIAAILCLAMAGYAAAGRSSLLLSRTALVASLCVALCGVGFVQWAPDNAARGPSAGLFVYFLGSVLGLLCAYLAGQRARSR